MPAPAVFLDRDGTLIEDCEYLSDPARVQLFPGAVEALRKLKARGYAVIIVTNQSGLGRGYFSLEHYEAVHARLLELVGDGLIDATYFCGDHPEHPSLRRKPEAGMLLEAAQEHGLDMARSWMVGDRASDLEAGRRAGVRSILVLTGLGAAADPAGAATVAKDFARAAEYILQTTDA